MFPRTLVVTLTVAAASTLALAQEPPLKTIREGALDRIELFVEQPPLAASSVVTIKPFTTDAAKLGTGVSGTKEQQQAAQALRTEAPKEFEAAFMKALTAGGLFKGVVRDGTGDIVVEGSFTDMNPGSPPNKSGVLGERSVMAVSGTVRDGSGKLLARFEQRRLAATVVLGADAAGKMRQDARNLGEDIAKFLKAWTSGKSLS
jgi:Domain of unknown function (DUF4410)